MDVTISPMLIAPAIWQTRNIIVGTNDVSIFLAHQFVEDEFTFCRFVRES